MSRLIRLVYADLSGRLSKNEMIRGNANKAEGKRSQLSVFVRRNITRAYSIALGASETRARRI